jgi:hypothetical protein
VLLEGPAAAWERAYLLLEGLGVGGGGRDVGVTGSLVGAGDQLVGAAVCGGTKLTAAFAMGTTAPGAPGAPTASIAARFATCCPA